MVYFNWTLICSHFILFSEKKRNPFWPKKVKLRSEFAVTTQLLFPIKFHGLQAPLKFPSVLYYLFIAYLFLLHIIVCVMHYAHILCHSTITYNTVKMQLFKNPLGF